MITLKAARVSAGLTRTDAAKKIGVSKSTLIAWDRYRIFSNVVQILKIVSIYNIKYDDIAFLRSEITLKV